MNNADNPAMSLNSGMSSIMKDLEMPPIPEKEVPTTPFDSIECFINDKTPADLKDFPFSLGEVFYNFKTVRKLPKRYFRQMEEIRRSTAEFREKYIRPVAHEIEKKVSEDPNYFPHDIIKKGSPYKFTTLVVPRQFGGPGYMSVHAAIMAEELAAGCGGFATSLAVSSAGSSQILMALDPYLIAVYTKMSIDAEKAGDPILWSGAVTEPNAGTDRWDMDFQNKNKAGMVAKRVEGGYVLNGSKTFISNGSVAQYSCVTAALDPADYKGTGCAFIVPTNSPGFSVGRVERKMGQKASATSEQICDNVFVPEKHRISTIGISAEGTMLYLAASRGPVGAIGVGCGRRALESLVQWAAERKNGRGRLIDQQALQMKISQFTRDLTVARNAYIQAGIAFDSMMHSLLGNPLISLTLWLTPKWVLRTEPFRRIVQSEYGRKFIFEKMRKIFSIFKRDEALYASGLAAIAKVVGSETGRKVAGEVMKIMGPDAADPRWGVDKAYRDARLTEIYEGTNEACAITTFKAMAASFQETLKKNGGK
ncbi:MAG TPA: acyl-CoA dehydrogenase family protein [Smithella sp.]|nr:acyl-CoA dehydrogenase family protein [Smithella sp.]